MKTKHYILLVLGGLIAFFAGFFIGKDNRAEKPPGTVTEETTETIVDTITQRAPVSLADLTLGTRRYTLPAYYFIGGGVGGEARQRGANDSICYVDSTVRNDGSGAGGMPRSCGDSAIVELPIIQRHYGDSAYEAWVSGPIDPQLDSLRVFARTTVITRQEWKPPKRWHIGPTVGYGYTPHGFEPYIGVSLTYSIFSF